MRTFACSEAEDGRSDGGWAVVGHSLEIALVVEDISQPQGGCVDCIGKPPVGDLVELNAFLRRGESRTEEPVGLCSCTIVNQSREQGVGVGHNLEMIVAQGGGELVGEPICTCIVKVL